MPYAPNATARDRVRALLGDTDDPPLLNGGEDAYDAALTAASDDVTAAARACCSALIAQLSLVPVRETAEGISVDYSARLPALRAVLAGLADDAGGAAGASSASVSVRVWF